MSFILDALRKSEHERQRNRAPGMADMQAPQKKSRRSLWLPLVALLAGLNLALLAVLWFAGSPAPATTAPVSRPDRSLATEMPVSPIDEPARLASIAPPPAPPVAPPATRAPAPAAVTAAGQNSSSRMLTVSEALLDGSLSITPLHLDIHVYSDNPSERFVFINTSRYTEGERISEGPTVASINKQGVILNYQGRDYLLSRD